MALGAGKYDAECELVRERTEASGAMVIVFSGKAGMVSPASCRASWFRRSPACSVKWPTR